MRLVFKKLINRLLQMTFERFLLKINKDIPGILSMNKDIPNDIIENINATLKSEISTLRGKQFYYVLNAISKNFDSDCNKAFDEFLRMKKDKPKTNRKIETNKYRKFINQFLVLQQDIADKAGIENTRLSKILSGVVKDFLAHEVYAIAISQGISAKSAFDQLYKE